MRNPNQLLSGTIVHECRTLEHRGPNWVHGGEMIDHSKDKFAGSIHHPSVLPPTVAAVSVTYGGHCFN